MFKKSGNKSTKQKTKKDPNKKCCEDKGGGQGGGQPPTRKSPRSPAGHLLANKRKSADAGNPSNTRKMLERRSRTEFAGIQNEGATCYLNALLQTLYMSIEMKNAVISLKKKLSQKKKKSIAYQLAVLFEELEAKRTGNTDKITKILGIDVTKQQDIAEYFQQILYKLDEEKDENTCNILQIYQSKLTNSLTCSECKAETPEEYSLLFIPLPVHLNDCGNSIQSVNAALKDFFKTVTLGGDNLCYCDHCGKKTKATMRHCCKSLPQILVLQLKRFEFDYSMKSFKKLHNKVEIPECLKFQKNEEVREAEWIPYSTKSEESAEALGKQQPSSSVPKRSNKNKVEEKQESQLGKRSFTTYKLFAICDHDGEFGFGHYVAHIRPATSDKWYRFNDAYVSEVENFFPEVCQNNTESMPCRRSSKAYLLMYRKENMNSNQDHVTTTDQGAERIKETRARDGKNRQTQKDGSKMAKHEKWKRHDKSSLPFSSCISGKNND